MTLEKKGASYRFNGQVVSKRLLRSICEEFFVKAIGAEIIAATERDGYAEVKVMPEHVARDCEQELQLANKKIAALENFIAKRQLELIYSDL